MSDELRPPLQRIDERLADVPLPATLERRIMASIAEPSGGSSRVFVGAAVFVAVVLAFVLGLRARPVPASAPQPAAEAPAVAAGSVQAPEPATPAPRHAWDGALAFDPECRIGTGDAELSVEDGCRMTLAAPALAMETWSTTRLSRTHDGVRVLAGKIAFAVEHVPEGEPRVRIEVDAGAIEVLGTRFAVVQDGARGHVDLLEGAIRFVDHAGVEHAVQPGRRLHWSDGHVVAPPEPETPPDTPPEPRPVAPTRAGFDLDATLETVAALRRAGRYRDAVDVLHRARRALGDAEGAEILSFEEGTLREHDTTGPKMCAFWRGHLARFPDGDYTAAVRTRLARTGCEDG